MTRPKMEAAASQILRDTEPDLWQALWRRIEAGDTPKQILKALAPAMRRMRVLRPSLPGLIEGTVRTLHREKTAKPVQTEDPWKLDW